MGSACLSVAGFCVHAIVDVRTHRLSMTYLRKILSVASKKFGPRLAIIIRRGVRNAVSRFKILRKI